MMWRDIIGNRHEDESCDCEICKYRVKRRALGLPSFQREEVKDVIQEGSQ
jgi:hypothetical protein